MRTALFVRELSTVTIRAKDPRDATVAISRFNNATQPAVGTYPLEAGIYLIVSSGMLEVSGVVGEVQTLVGDKEPWPVPTTALVALEPGASTSSIQEFFTIAKDISIDG